ncbi:hypothetical protein GEMRC1_000916 [Eukaryota sp. GEM-RC1]
MTMNSNPFSSLSENHPFPKNLTSFIVTIPCVADTSSQRSSKAKPLNKRPPLTSEVILSLKHRTKPLPRKIVLNITAILRTHTNAVKPKKQQHTTEKLDRWNFRDPSVSLFKKETKTHHDTIVSSMIDMSFNPKQWESYLGGQCCDLINDVCYSDLLLLSILNSMMDTSIPSTAPEFGSEPKVSLSVWIQHILCRSQSPLICAFLALFYLNKLQKSYPHLRFTEVNVRRSYLAAFILASKFLQDQSYNNSSWAIIGFSHYSTDLINSMERELLSLLDWNLSVSTESLQQFLFPFIPSNTI